MVNSGRRYEIEAPLGKGGFGTVYRARFVGEGGFSKVVALKVLNERMQDLEEVLARLRDEARLLGMLRHRAIVRADRLVRLANRWAVVMEYVEGADLKRVLAETTVPMGAAVEIIGEVAGALHSAWKAPGPDGAPLHLIHRDIKPSNIVLTSYGEIKVLDFGIARADFGTREAETRAHGMGSLPYMAPERLDFRDTAAADVYALGVVFFELVTGRAFGRASAVPERHTKHVDAALRFLVEQGLSSRDLLLFLGSLLAYDPDDRPSAGQLERMCSNLRRRFEDEPLRYWAEQVVPGILTSIAKLPADTLTGSSLVEQTEGTFADLHPGAGGTDSGSFRRPVAGVAADTGGTGSGAFSRPVARVATASTGSGSGSFSRPVAQAATGSTGTGERVIPPPPPPPPSISGAYPRPVVRSSEPGPAVTPAVIAPPDPAPEPRPVRGRSRMLGVLAVGVLLLLILVAGLGVGAVIMFKLEEAANPVPAPVPEAPVESAAPAEDAPPEPEPAPPDVTPRVPEPASVEPRPQPAVVSDAPGASPQPTPSQPGATSPAPAPSQVASQPSPGSSSGTAAETTPEQEPVEEQPRGRVVLEGDADRVVLVGTAGSFVLPASVPEGSYTIRATFSGREPMVAGRATVHGGGTTTVRCSAGFTRCKAE